jgi:hypothetical protein
MRWDYLSIDGMMGPGLSVQCSVCGRTIPDSALSDGDIAYSPRGFTDEQAGWIKRLWSVDPYSKFSVCEGCMAGYCGAVDGLTADKWLGEWVREFEAGRATVTDYRSDDYANRTKSVHPGLRRS